jgi:translation initiation factor IF-3
VRVARSPVVRKRRASRCSGRGPSAISGLFFHGRSKGEGVSPVGTPGSEVTEISEKRVRVNEQIRISPIRLIGDQGEQIGIVSIDEARDRAADKGLDLVEVAPEARPPVVKMMDYGKYKYEAARQAREARKKQHTIQVKEVKFRPGIEEHDYDFKTRHARRFLEEGNKVKLTMMFRGRQVTHPELGLEVLARVTEDLQDVGKVEQNPNFEGRVMSMILAPLKLK